MSFEHAFLNNTSADYVADLYARYQKDKASVEPSWVEFFDGLGDAESDLLKEMTGASWAPKDSEGHFKVANEDVRPSKAKLVEQGFSTEQIREAALESVRAIMLIRAYRVRGHLMADTDPLGLHAQEPHPELDPLTYGFVEEDFDRPIFINGVLGKETATLNEILEICRNTYCGHIGMEFMHIQEPEAKAWLQARIEEPQNKTDFTERGRRAILERLTEAEGLENFLHKKYVGTKRFGLDGGESVIPGIEQILKRGSQLGIQEVVLGMAHRGRLNVLTNIMHKPFTAIFSEFQGNSSQPSDVQGSGDVKYHLGTSADREFDGKKVHLSLNANPSHLEAVAPVVVGKVRAKQDQLKDDGKKKVMGIILHGDAAMAGQGLVSEVFHLSNLSGYRTGGTIHIVINNQIGFTTTPQYARSSPYPTDVAKVVQAPIFHVNGDDAEAVVHAARIAMEYRQEFGKDVVLDIIGYRRFGHNEGDEPAFTQPIMYDRIKKQKPVRAIYAEHLAHERVVDAEQAEKIRQDFEDYLEKSFQEASAYKPRADMLEGAWTGMELPEVGPRRGKTGAKVADMVEVGNVITTVPEDFKLNTKIARQFSQKMENISQTGENIDWATAEALAFGVLLKEGYGVRLSGQDCGRGTFSQRHAILYNQENGEKYIPLQHLSNKQGQFEVIDSPLSEFAVMGFDYGYSLAEPNALVLWEGQFGDFANGAQVMIDQFIASAEAKWLRMSGLVLLLPHGYEGQGPEHSSARLERFLQLCAEDNLQVANCTTPANYFHILRRQMHRKFRKPLVLMTPKSLLRHKMCVSPLKHFKEDTTFHRVIDERHLALKPDAKIKRIVLCTGKVYYDLYQKREEAGIDDVTIVRLEQIYPFPDDVLVDEIFPKYKNADVVWCQEEPENMGAWTFVDRRIEKALLQAKHKTKRPIYAGRPAAASPATGILSHHNKQQEDLVNDALGIKSKKK